MISIVVPVYKSEKTLFRCVESLQKQTERNIEIILVDDGSPDKCPALCDELAKTDERIKVLHQKNSGVSAARNAGIRAAKGKYVSFVDSDDYVEPDYCAHMKNAVENSGAEMAICGYHHHYVGADVEKVPKAEMDMLNLYENGFLNMPWNKLFLREALGQFPEDMSLGEDLLFNLDYLKSSKKVALVDEPLYHYIQEENSQTLSGKKRADKLELAKRIRKEAAAFFQEQSTNGSEQEKWNKNEIRQVVDTRFLCECLDEIERLPFDKTMTESEKREAIKKLSTDKTVHSACRHAKPAPLDYQILQWTLGYKFVVVTYVLSIGRSYIVKLKRRKVI